MARPRWYRPDAGLTFRMALVMFLLAALYLGFIAVLDALRVPLGTLVVIVGLMLLAQYYWSDRMVLLATGAREVSPAQAPELHRIVERLAQQANIPKPRVAIIPTDLPNALATGRNPRHAVVAVTQGLLRRLDADEIEAVLGHELSHVLHRDVAVITIASFFATVASFILQQFFWFGFGGFGGGFGGDRRRDNGGVNAAIIIWLVSLIVWAVSYLLIRALSRYRELAADRGSAYLTGRPSTLASALIKISQVIERVPTRDLRRVEAANAFFIIPALHRDSLMQLFSTHPSLKVRLAQLEALAREMER
jgi:heat shock protein HtpX